MNKNNRKQFPKLKWRVGWFPIGHRNTKPVYSVESFENWNEAEYIAKEMSKSDKIHHFFVDSVPKE